MIGWIPPQDLNRERERKQMAEAERAAKQRTALPTRPPETCHDCFGRRWMLVDHIAKACGRCKGRGVEP